MEKAASAIAVSCEDARHDFLWKWRSKDGRAESRQAFVFFYDCMEDARRNGYGFEIQQAQGESAPKVNPGGSLG